MLLAKLGPIFETLSILLRSIAYTTTVLPIPQQYRLYYYSMVFITTTVWSLLLLQYGLYYCIIAFAATVLPTLLEYCLYTSTVLPAPVQYCLTTPVCLYYYSIAYTSTVLPMLAQYITGSNYDVRSKEILERLGWEPIDTILKQHEIIMTFKALKGVLPECMSNMFKIKQNDIYQLRGNDHKLYLEKPNTDVMKKSSCYRGAMAWNKLSCDVVNRYDQLSTKSFKKIISNHFDLMQSDSWHLQVNIVYVFMLL